MPSTSSSGRRLQAKPGEQAAPPAVDDRLDPANPREDELVDQASSESMDASDPPSFGGATGVGTPPPADLEDPAGLAGAGTFSGEEDDQRRRMIERRAHELWDAAGRPEGSDQEFWYQAEAELEPADDSETRPL